VKRERGGVAELHSESENSRLFQACGLFGIDNPGSEEWLQYRKSVACIIATNVSPPDAQPLFANGLMRAGLARVVSCFPYRGVLRSRKHR
jgi:hypothetical protein